MVVFGVVQGLKASCLGVFVKWAARAHELLHLFFLVVLLVGTLAGCDKTNTTLPQASGVVFSGIQRIEPVGNGRWRLTWSPVTDLSDSSYLVFERSEAGGSFDFTQPVSRTDENFFITADLRLFDSKCYVVRSLIKGEAADLNKNEICTGHQAFAFAGLRDLQPLEKGNYLLTWNLSPYSKREMGYEIRERKRGQKVWAVAGTTTENFYPTRIVSIEEVVCFNVRYIHSSLKKDMNEREVCTDEENTGNFTGIREIVKANDARGGYDILWERSSRSDVIGYRIFKGLQMKDLVAETGADKSSFRVTGLGIGATYEFGVKLVTRSGRLDGNTKTLRVTVENDKPVVTTVAVQSIERLGADGKTTRDRLQCDVTFVDPDRSHGKIYPKIEFKAQLTTGERPILLREKIIGDPVVLDKNGQGSFSANYVLNASKDRRGSDLFCEVTAFDGIDSSEPKRSSFIVLPDSAPVATGMFISKKAYFDQNLGTTHYYDSSVGGEPGQVLSKVVKGQIVTESHACMISGNDGAIQNKASLDICEDTVVPVVVKKVVIPVNLLEPGKESELNAFRKNIAYVPGAIGDDYKAFFANLNNRAKLGYYDPDDSDIASRIEVREVKNGTVASARCLEGVCNIDFVLAKDYNSGSDLGDRDSGGVPYKHAQLEYRVRTYEPLDETSCASLDGTPCALLGWSDWAPLKLEVTAVDEEPRVTGITVRGIEDRVQKVVFCNQRRNDPDHTAASQIDPECALDKTITLNPDFDPTKQDESFKYLSGKGFGYFDLEDDPMVRVLPDALVPSTIGAWVVPVVASPDLENRSHWQPIANIPLTASEACDQTAIDSVTGQPMFCPFHCDKEASKCIGYFMPAVDVHSKIELGYDLWVEVDPVANPDPSFAGLQGKDREVKAAQPGKIFLEIEKMNDVANLASIAEPNWMEDEHDAIPHQIFFKRVLSYLSSPVAGAIYVPYYDPDIVRSSSGQVLAAQSDMLRRAVDMEVRFSEGGVWKYSYCATTEVPRQVPNDYPGTLVAFPNICTLNTGTLKYVPVPPAATAGASTEFMSQMKLTCAGNGDCDGELIYPPNYHGVHSFEYRIQTTRLDDNNNVVLDTKEGADWSPWKSVELVTSSVADPPRTFNVSLGGQDSFKATIREDINFTVKLVKGKGIGGYNLLVPGADIPEQRYYEGYFDVDETDDIAYKIKVTGVAEYTAGTPVLLDKNGNPLMGDDNMPINSSATGNTTAFQCDGNGICTAEFRTAQNFFVPDGQPDPWFDYMVSTYPKNISDRPEPMVPFKPVRDLSSPANAKGRVSFNVAPIDDAPGLTGAGGIALPEDSPTVFIVKKQPGPNEIGYSEIEDWNLAEKIEIANIVFYDPAIQPTLVDGAGSPNGMGYPDGTANGYPNPTDPNAPYIFQPNPISRGAPGSTTSRLIIRGEDFSNRIAGIGPFKVNEAQVDNYIKPADPANNLPQRWQFLCRRDTVPDISAGECWIEVRSPLHFNTGTAATSASDPRPDALRIASFQYRIFSRDPNLWKPADDSEDGGSWSAWSTVPVKFDPVNDAPSMAAAIDLATAARNGQTGIMSAANPWRIKEDTEDYLEFKWGLHYIDPDYSTESYTYKEDLSVDALPPFLPSDMRYSSRFLATKIAVFDLVAATKYFGKDNLDYATIPRCPLGRKSVPILGEPARCLTNSDLEQIQAPGTAFPTRSFLSSSSRPTTLAVAGSTFAYVHNLNVSWSSFSGWNVYDYTKSPPLLSEANRNAHFEVDLAATNNNQVVFRRKIAPNAAVGANVTFELGLPQSLESRAVFGMAQNDTFDFTHSLNVPFAGENSWDVSLEPSGTFLTTAERNNTFEVIASNNALIKIRKIGPGFGTDFRFHFRFPQHWMQSYLGDFYGPPAADALVTATTNINCDPEGNCRFSLAPPPNFNGTFSGSIRIADGSSAPKEKDWTPDSQKVGLHVLVEDVDDLPVVATNDLVLDLIEDRRFEFAIVSKTNEPNFEGGAFDVNNFAKAYSPATPSQKTVSNMTLTPGALGGYGTFGQLDCACGGCNIYPALPHFNAQAPAPWQYPPNFFVPVVGEACIVDTATKCDRCDFAYLLALYGDNDRDWASFFDFTAVPDAARVIFFDPGAGGYPTGLGRQQRTTPFLWQVNPQNFGQEYYTLQGAPNFYNAKYNRGNFGAVRPYEYITSPQGSGSTPWVDDTQVSPTGTGDLYFDVRVKTFAGDASASGNGIDCSDPAACWSGSARVYMRIHPQDDSAATLNPVSTTIRGAPAQVANVFTVKEDEFVELSVTPADYLDPDHNPLPGEGKAIGLRPCIKPFGGSDEGDLKDHGFFSMSDGVLYETKREATFSGSRLDPLAAPHSLLRIEDSHKFRMEQTVSSGKVRQSTGLPVKVSGMLGTGKACPQSGCNAAQAIVFPQLTAQCDMTPGPTDAAGATPTGNCRLKVKPDDNIFGEYKICLKLATLAQAGDAEDTKDLWSPPIYFKVVIENLDDPPHAGQLAVRARANEDHLADVEFGPNQVKWNTTGGKIALTRPEEVLMPGYWDLDSSYETVNTSGLTGDALAAANAQNALVDENLAEYVYVNMAPDEARGFTGIRGGTLLFRSDPSLSRADLNNFDSNCSFGNGSEPGSNICKIKCEASGICFFKFKAAADEPKAAGTGKHTMSWWVSSKGGLKLSSRRLDNLAANRAAGGLESVRLGSAFAGADYLFTEKLENYDLNADFQCLPPGEVDLFGWRVAGLEEEEVAGIPGLFMAQAFSPISNPVYAVARPASQQPNPLRLVPNTSTVGFDKWLRLLKPGGVLTPDQISTGDAACVVWGQVGGELTCTAFGASPLPSPYGLASKRRTSFGAACGNMEFGRLNISFEPVSDKPFASKTLVRNLSGSRSSLLTFTQSTTPGLDGYTDADGDKPLRLTFLNEAQMVDPNGVLVGTLSLSPTPPAVPAGFAELPLDSEGRRYIPQEALISAPGCSVNVGDCSVYFHPKPGYNGTVALDFTISTVGADAFEWESDRTGPDGPGKMTFNISSTAPVITVTGAEPYQINEDALGGVLRVQDGSAYLSIGIDEGGGAEADADEVVVSFTSSDPLVIDPTKITFSNANGTPRVDGPSGTASNFGAAEGVVTITPELDRFTEGKTPSEVIVVLRATKVESGLYSEVPLRVVVKPVPDAPTIGVAPLPVSSPANDYTVVEDGTLTINNVFVDEGGGNDENGEILSVSFSSSNLSIIDPSTDIVVNMSDEANANNDAGATGRSIVITPKANTYTDANGVILTMSVDDNDGAGVPTTRQFKVVVTPANDPPVMTSGPSAQTQYLTATGTPLVLNNVRFDEGGVIDGVGSENNQTLTVAFASSNTGIIDPATDVVVSGTADTALLDSNALVKTITVTPKGFGLGVLLTIKISDDTGTTWVEYPVNIDVRKPPEGPITCTAGGGTGGDEFIFGVGQPITGIACSGLAAAFTAGNATAYGTDAAEYEIAAVAQSTCPTGLGGVNIDPATGALSGVMPTSDCNVVVSGNDTSAANTKVVAAQRKLLKLQAASITGIAFANPAIGNTCVYSMDVSPSYYLNRSSFASATPTITGGGFAGAFANNSIFTANLTDFTKTSATLGLTIADTTGHSKTESQLVNISASDVARVKVAQAAANLAGLVAEGAQVSFDFENHCVDTTTCNAQLSALVGVGGDHTCVLGANDKLYCFGENNADGRLGLAGDTGTPAIQATAQEVPGVLGARALALGKNHTCFITSGGVLKCFGENDNGELGLDSTAVTTAPASSVLPLVDMDPDPLVTDMQPMIAAAVVAGDNHTCVLGAGSDPSLGAGKVYCVGKNTLDQLGYNTSLNDALKYDSALESAGITNAVALAAGKNHTCALTGELPSREVKCWGSNASNQLGLYSADASVLFASPAQVGNTDPNNQATSVLKNAVAIAAGGNHTCAILADGSVRCWGSNSSGQLGDGTTAGTDSHLAADLDPMSESAKPIVTPVGFDGASKKAVSLALGEAHTCILTAARELWCFGANASGQLGINSTNDTPLPTKVNESGGTQALLAVAVAAGQAHTCVLTQAAKLLCSGKGTAGALGNNQAADSAEFVEATALPGLAQPAVRQCKKYGVSF